MLAILYPDGSVGGVAEGVDIYAEAERLGGQVVEAEALPPAEETPAPVVDPVEKLREFLAQNPDVAELLSMSQ
ncbi:hypothetical protein IRZ59_20345 [Pseudomonas guariconensis]|uniref:hypothetical protein n=1 Tax=Pseudomonas guariconensis TaxID=1288410 RepID=UPI0018ABE411|nr:hypothetical protein [Pseudomonas guariconensis]MBF8732789.1 hypothetical protein [Pseudomonas guariconensis]